MEETNCTVRAIVAAYADLDQRLAQLHCERRDTHEIYTRIGKYRVTIQVDVVDEDEE